MDFLFILCLIIDSALVWYFIRALRRRKNHRDDWKYQKLYSGVHELNSIVTQLEELEQVQVSIELARYHKMKGVTISVPGSFSQEHEHTLLINGHDNSSRYLLETVNEEKERLRADLNRKLLKLSRNGVLNDYSGTELINDCSAAHLTSAFQKKGSEEL